MDSYLTVTETATHLGAICAAAHRRAAHRLLSRRATRAGGVIRCPGVAGDPTRRTASGRLPDPSCLAEGVMTGKQNGKSRRRFGRVRQLPSGRWQARYPAGLMASFGLRRDEATQKGFCPGSKQTSPGGSGSIHWPDGCRRGTTRCDGRGTGAELLVSSPSRESATPRAATDG
jgi:hypothetical protein